MDEAESRNIIRKAIDELPEEEKKIIALHYLEGLTLDEIGEVLYPENKTDNKGRTNDKQ